MNLASHIKDLFKATFLKDSDDNIAIRTSTKGELIQTGLNKGGRVTVTPLNSLTWTKVINVPLVVDGSKRNQINIQNQSGQKVVINFADDIIGFVGMVLNDRSERQYTIQGDIVLYAKCESGNCNILVEELA